MTKVYDDWERLVRATLRRHELWLICHDHSRSPSGGSTTSGTSPGSGGSPVADQVAPQSSSAVQVSPLNDQKHLKAKISSSTVHFSPLNGRKHPEAAGPSKSKNDKPLKKGKSRMRLDKWILTRWLSKSFN